MKTCKKHPVKAALIWSSALVTLFSVSVVAGQAPETAESSAAIVHTANTMDSAINGTASDVPANNAEESAVVSGVDDLIREIAHNRISINIVWTLFAGFLVMFMQAGFALIETGMCRRKMRRTSWR